MSEIEDLGKKLVDLKRQRRELESECPECNTKKTEDEDCPECRISAGIGMYLNICKEIDSEKNCEDLFEKVDSGEITSEEFFDIIKEKAKDDPEKLDILEYTDELMDSEDIDTKTNPKKEVKGKLYCKDGCSTEYKKIPVAEVEMKEKSYGWGDTEASQQKRGSEYAILMKKGIYFPPIKVFGKRHKSDTYLVFDGHARLVAHRISNEKFIGAEITLVDEKGNTIRC